MENAASLLESRTVRELGAVAHCYGLPFNNRKPKPYIHARLAEQLGAGQHLRRVYRDLPAESRDALRTLHAAGGRLSADQFARDFGTIRPYRPWHVEAPRQPWKCPESVAEKLWYLAFIERQGDQIVLCDAVAPLLPPLPNVHPMPVMYELEIESDTPDTLLIDMALFLGMLTRERVRLRYGQQLAPRVFRAINARLQQPEVNVELARSERQIGRVRWLHYLAACAGLIEVVNGTLKPSFTAWQWLDAAPDVRWQQLQSAIRDDLAKPVPLWTAYHLPRISLAAWDALITGLESLPVGAVYNVRPFLRKLRIECPGLVAEDVRALLAGPLSWLGYVITSADGKQFALFASTCGEGLDKTGHTSPCGGVADKADLVPTNACSGVGTGPALSGNIPALSAKIEENALFIHLNLITGTMPLRPLAEALAWIGIEDDRLTTLRIDSEAVQRALRCGLGATQIADVIRRLTGTALSQTAFDQVNTWAANADQVRIEHADLLYTADPALLSRLYADRRVKPLLDKPISPHHAVIRAGERETLNKQLQRRGYRAQSEAIEVPPDSTVTQDTASAAWLAMRVYQALGELIPQALPIPGAVSDEIKMQLSPGQQDQLERAATNLVEQLRQAIRGQVSMLSASPVAQDDPHAIRTAIEQAYQDRQPITIAYFSPAHGSVTERTIEPLLPIRDEGDYSYIEAWCRLQNESRTFRLDRILRVIVVKSECSTHDPTGKTECISLPTSPLLNSP